MRDFPVFATENGVASLVLKEITYKQEAYIYLQDTQTPEALLKECADFCTAAGAERILATGHSILEQYPLHTVLIAMRCSRESIPETDAALFPVQPETFETWREIYNRKMAAVHNAATITAFDRENVIGGGYFVHRGDTLLGIGKVSGSTIEVVAAQQQGAGREVLAALCYAITGDTVELEVAKENLPAVRLYEKMGFVPVREISRWYRVK